MDQINRQLLKWLLSLAALFLAYPADAQWSFYVDVDSFVYSEPISIDGFINDWEGTFEGGESAFTYNRFEIGFENPPWRFAVLARYDYVLDFSRDTAELYYREQNKLELERGRTYAINLTANHVVSNGIQVAYRYEPTPPLSIEMGVSLLRATKFIDGGLRGSVIETDDSDLDFSVNVDYFYSKDQLFERQADTPEGVGLTLDVAVDYQITKRLAARLDVTDLIGRIYWDTAPFTNALATSDTKTTDEEGFLRVKAALSGIEGERDFVQNLDRRIFSSLLYRYSPVIDLLAESHYFRLKTFYNIGVQYHLSDNSRWQWLADVENRSGTIRYSSQSWSLALTSDAVKWQDARIFGFNIQWHQTH